jgi:putative MATE family efflux protein
MKDLTQGSIPRHVLAMALPIAAGMLLSTLYYLIDLYFVSRLGDAAIAGVSAAGNVFFLVFAVTQTLGVGTTTLMSHAVGRKNRDEANHVFNQSVALAAVCTIVTLVAGYGLCGGYMRLLGADAATAQAGKTYLEWFLPGLAMQFATVVMGSALRATGIVKPTMLVQMVTVLLNVILAPVLIAGWGTGHPLGVAGAGLASSIAIGVGVVMLVVYFARLEKYVAFDSHKVRPQLKTWLRMLDIGAPAGGEFVLMALFTGVIYWVIRDFGAAAQAGFGIGSRLMQAMFLPAIAIAFAAAPIVGQNFGAGHADRVRETFKAAAVWGIGSMALLALITQWQAEAMARWFTSDPAVIAVCAQFLHFISWNFITGGFVFICSSIFQGIGNTWPPLFSSAVRVVTFAIPVIWLSGRPGFEIVDVWYLSVVTVVLQAIVTYTLLQMQLRKRLPALLPRPSA